jgi:hypothetical protein
MPSTPTEAPVEFQPDPQPQPQVWLLITETPVPGVLLGTLTLLLPEAEDPEIGWSTTDDGEAW